MDFSTLLGSITSAAQDVTQVDAAIQGADASITAVAQSTSSQLGTSAHIAAQNQTVAQMGAILDAYHAGRITNSVAQAQVKTAVATFVAFCKKLGYARAIRGANDVQTLANRVLQDLQNQALGITPAPVLTASPLANLTAGIPSLGGLSPIALGALGFVAFKMFKGRF